MVATIPGIASFTIVHHRRSRTPLSVPTNWSTGPKRALCRRPPAPPPGPKCHRSLKARLPSKRALIQEVRANTVRAIPACPADDPACLADVAASARTPSSQASRLVQARLRRLARLERRSARGIPRPPLGRHCRLVRPHARLHLAELVQAPADCPASRRRVALASRLVLSQPAKMRQPSRPRTARERLRRERRHPRRAARLPPLQSVPSCQATCGAARTARMLRMPPRSARPPTWAWQRTCAERKRCAVPR